MTPVGPCGGGPNFKAGRQVSPARFRFNHFGQTEVRHFYPPAPVHQNVFRLDVAVDDAQIVGKLERVANLRHDGQRFARRDAARREQLAQRDAIHEFHEQVIHSARLAEIMDGDDVRVAQPRQGLGLLFEAPGEGGVFLPFRREDFQGDQAVEAGLARFVHDTHPAASQALDDFQLGKVFGEIAGRGRGGRRGTSLDTGRGGFAGEVGLRSQVQGQETGRTKAVHRAGGGRRAAFQTGPIGRSIFVHHLLLGKLLRCVTGFLEIISWWRCQDGDQVAQLRVHFARPGHGAGDFLAEQFAIPLAQTMHGHARRAFAQPGRRRRLRVWNFLPVRREKCLETLELAVFAGLGKLSPQPCHRSLQQRQRPLAVISQVRRRFAGRVGRLAESPRLGIQRNRPLAAAAFLGAGLVRLIGEKALERGQQERAEAPLPRVGAGDPVMFEKPRKKFLGQVPASWGEKPRRRT